MATRRRGIQSEALPGARQHRDPNRDVHANCFDHIHGHSDEDRNADEHVHPNAHSDAHADPNSDADEFTYANRESDSVSNTDCVTHAVGHADLIQNSHQDVHRNPDLEHGDATDPDADLDVHPDAESAAAVSDAHPDLDWGDALDRHTNADADANAYPGPAFADTGYAIADAYRNWCGSQFDADEDEHTDGYGSQAEPECDSVSDTDFDGFGNADQTPPDCDAGIFTDPDQHEDCGKGPYAEVAERDYA